MGRRKYPRVKMTLPTKAWTGSQPTPLGQNCVTYNLTPTGVCLNGVTGVKEGEIISLAYHRNSCRFRVVWVGAPFGPQRGMVGLENLEPNKHVFGVGFPPPQVDEFIPPSKEACGREGRERGRQPRPANEERRAHPRYGCTVGVEVRAEGSNVRTWAKLTDLSLGGCYVNTVSPFEPDTRVALVLRVQELEMKARGIVRVRHPGFGMGVQFTRISDEDRQKIAELVNQLAQASATVLQSLSPPHPPAVAPAPAPQQAEHDAGRVLAALFSCFAEKDVVTKEEFQRLLEQSRKQDEESAAAATAKVEQPAR